ncbi:hypothetical protein GCM10010178_91310 [Lentzea flava]|uniref:Uncharacterized protein n=1 Tax=Lentzea flava TaxID=103732 RepID=A0ABQ2VIG4_9PSEU|nr:hypothetical protein [Lentzea flava]GGU87161.1 hypothetical protein GCM10010178_91310 [Lentzea flava]
MIYNNLANTALSLIAVEDELNADPDAVQPILRGARPWTARRLVWGEEAVRVRRERVERCSTETPLP